MEKREETEKLLSVEDYNRMIIEELTGIKGVKFAKYIYDFIRTAKKYWK